MGAKVDGRIMPIDTVVKTGMIIEIITGNTKGPNRDWLKVVKTSEARNKIRAWFKKEKREENIAAGREELGEGIPAQLHQPDRAAGGRIPRLSAEKQQMKNVVTSWLPSAMAVFRWRRSLPASRPTM